MVSNYDDQVDIMTGFQLQIPVFVSFPIIVTFLGVKTLPWEIKRFCKEVESERGGYQITLKNVFFRKA